MALHTVPLFVDESEFDRIDGQLVKRQAGGKNHASAQGCIYLLLWEKVRPLNMEAQVEWSLTRPDTLGKEDNDYLTADVLVAKKPYSVAQNGHLIPPAYLAVEVISPGQQLAAKAQIYASWGVEHIWIIHPETRECFYYVEGFLVLAEDELRAGELAIQINDIFDES